LATVAVSLELGLSFERIVSGLEQFRGAERRFDVRGERDGVMVIDDYGHHPTEIAAVIASAKAFNRRIVVAFQPHRYSRTAALLDAFGPALAGADHVVLSGIYAAGEDPLSGVTIERLAESVRRAVPVPVEIVERIEDVPRALARIARPGDVVITLGAGSIGTVADRLLPLLGGPA
jgi:UDP-N-acetylmuramate--alanine ligase